MSFITMEGPVLWIKGPYFKYVVGLHPFTTILAFHFPDLYSYLKWPPGGAVSKAFLDRYLQTWLMGWGVGASRFGQVPI